MLVCGSAKKETCFAVQARLRGALPAALALAAEARALLQASLARLRALLPGAGGGRGRRQPGAETLGCEPDEQTLEATLQGLADLAWERRECWTALRLYVQARLRGVARNYKQGRGSSFGQCPCAFWISSNCLWLCLQAAALGELGEAVGGGPLPAPMVHRMCDCLNALAMPLPAAALLQLLQPPDHNGACPLVAEQAVLMCMALQ